MWSAQVLCAPYKNGELEFWRAEKKKKPLARQTDPLLRLLLPTYENEKNKNKKPPRLTHIE